MKINYSQIDLACEQLETAIELFLSRRSFVSSLTLAGATEEILGKALGLNSEKNVLQCEAGIIKPVHELLHKKAFIWKDFIDGKNFARNSAKHLNNNNEQITPVDFEEEAYKMLVRACDNHQRLGISPTENMRKFEDWFYKNVIGL